MLQRQRLKDLVMTVVRTLVAEFYVLATCINVQSSCENFENSCM